VTTVLCFIFYHRNLNNPKNVKNFFHVNFRQRSRTFGKKFANVYDFFSKHTVRFAREKRM